MLLSCFDEVLALKLSAVIHHLLAFLPCFASFPPFPFSFLPPPLSPPLSSISSLSFSFIFHSLYCCPLYSFIIFFPFLFLFPSFLTSLFYFLSFFPTPFYFFLFPFTSLLSFLLTPLLSFFLFSFLPSLLLPSSFFLPPSSQENLLII